MAELMDAIFYSFWTFAGTAILLGIVTRGLVAIVALVALGGRRNG